MKSLLAIFAVGAALMLGAAAPASAETVDNATLQCLVLDKPDGRVVNTCICQAVHNLDWEIKRRLPVAPARLGLNCPNGGGGGSASSGESSDKPHDHKGHGFSFSMATSSSGVLSVGTFYYGNPVAFTLQGQDNTSLAIGNGSANATGGTTGGAFAASTGSPSGASALSETPRSSGGISGSTGGTGGSTCAGSGCGGGNPE